jgi:hypothetical protein
VRIEEVDPQEERAVARRLLQPRDGARGGALRGPLADHEQLRLVLGPEVVVVGVEALVEPVPAREHRGRDEGAGRVADVAEAFGERHRVGRERIVPVVANPVRLREQAGEDGRVRRQRDRRARDGVGAAHALAGQAIHRGRDREAEAVASHTVDAQGVDRDDEDVRRSPAVASGSQGADETEEQETGKPARGLSRSARFGSRRPSAR